MNATHTAYLSLGSNLDDRLENLQIAVQTIHETISPVSKISSTYQTPAWGFEGNDFFNICIEIQTKQTAHILLKNLLELEIELGRKRNINKTYQNRNIDIDIILYEDQIINTPSLIIPHPRALNRKFVLFPLIEIMKSDSFPNSSFSMSEHLKKCTDESQISITSNQIKTI